jgi:hypothetical protein
MAQALFQLPVGAPAAGSSTQIQYIIITRQVAGAA